MVFFNLNSQSKRPAIFVKPFLRGFQSSLGINPLTALRSISNTPFYFYSLLLFLFKVFTRSSRQWRRIVLFPCLMDRGVSSGSMPRHYFLQDLLVAQKIYKLRPTRHLDIGSRVDGLVAHIASFRNVEVADIRPMEMKVDGISFRMIDLSAQLPADCISAFDSVSCLHALEHFGLGRYGDSIDPDGYLKGIENLASLLCPGGSLHLSVPVGLERVEFNAHRVFSPRTIISACENMFTLVEFSLIDDEGILVKNVDILSSPHLLDGDGMNYACGIFQFQKLES